MDLRLQAPSLSKTFHSVRKLFHKRKGKIVLLLVCSFLPFLSICAYWSHAFLALKNVQEELDLLWIKAAKAHSDKITWETYVHNYVHPNPYYFEESIETMNFLKNEKEKLSALLEAAMFSNHEELQRRYRFITGGENSLRFSEQQIFESKKWKESILSQLTPVEIDEEDFLTILQKIEGKAQGKPQCTITSCLLSDESGGTVIRFECLKRELLQE